MKLGLIGIGRLLEDDTGIELRAGGYETDSRWAAYRKQGRPKE